MGLHRIQMKGRCKYIIAKRQIEGHRKPRLHSSGLNQCPRRCCRVGVVGVLPAPLMRKPFEGAAIEGLAGRSSLVGLPPLPIRASSEVAGTLAEEFSFNFFAGGCPPEGAGLGFDTESDG